ncbi:unnamed protein product, partial [Oppiella nova]
MHDVCRVVVTGIGTVCPLGVTTDQVWSNLIAGKCGVSGVVGEGYETIPCKVAAYVPTGDGFDLNQWFTANELRTLSKATIYALIAAEQALSDANWRPTTDRDRRDTGVAVGTGMIDMNEVIRNGEALSSQGFRMVSPHFVT